ncbi:MAG TPA: hypothetical protein G4O18_06630 [Dehalococcoidia bacterium]|nr:hypothetical protein [Dehalococcoidia bacterium]
MIGVDEILDALKVTVYTGAIKGENPLSIFLMAKVGSGKTSMVKQVASKTKVEQVEVGKGKDKKKIDIRKIDGSVLYATQVTPFALYTSYGAELKKGHIKHIIIPDFLSILNQPKYQMMQVVQFFNHLIEEGIMSVESRDSRFLSEVPVTVGLITTMAKQDFRRRKPELAACGFLSRLLPLSFRYSDKTKVEIIDSIGLREYRKAMTNFNIKLPPETEVELRQEEVQIIKYLALRCKDPEDDLGARRVKQLQLFAMGNALMDGRDITNSADTDKILEYIKFVNYECRVEI